MEMHVITQACIFMHGVVTEIWPFYGIVPRTIFHTSEVNLLQHCSEFRKKVSCLQGWFTRFHTGVVATFKTVVSLPFH